MGRYQLRLSKSILNLFAGKERCYDRASAILPKTHEDIRVKIGELLQGQGSPDDFIAKNVVGTPDECVGKIQEYVNLGVSHFIFHFQDSESLRLFAGSVIPAFSGRRA